MTTIEIIKKPGALKSDTKINFQPDSDKRGTSELLELFADPVVPRNRTRVTKNGNDKVYTPDDLAMRIVEWYKPSGRILESCLGKGAFHRAIEKFTGTAPDWCENDEAVLPQGERPRDFFDCNPSQRYDWIVTNPPYSLLTDWLEHSMEIADNVLLLIEAPAAEFTSREKRTVDAGFEMAQRLRVATPPEWVAIGLKSGFGFTAVHWKRGHAGDCKRSRLTGWNKGAAKVELVTAASVALILITILFPKIFHWLGW